MRLHATEAVGHAHRRGPLGQLERVPGKAERDGVGQHVAGVGEQRQRAGEESADCLRDHETRRQAGGDQDALLVSPTVNMAQAMAMTGMVMAGVFIPRMIMPGVVMAFVIVTSVVMIVVIVAVSATTG